MSHPPQLSAELFRLALDSLADSVTIHDAAGKLLYVNQATAKLMGGQSVEDILAAEPGAWQRRFTMYAESGREIDVDELPGRRVFQEEEPDPLLVRSVDNETGSARWVRIQAAPLVDGEGRVLAAVNVSEDVTDVKEAERAQRLLADAGATLSASLDYEHTLQEVARLAVPQLADWCGVDLVDPHGEIQQVAVAHVDPDKVVLGRTLREQYPVSMDDEAGIATVLRTGEPQLVQDIADEMLVQAAQDERHLAMLRAIGLRSVLIMPLRFGDSVIGAMSYVLQDRAFSDGDIAIAEELSRRAVTAIENSRLYTERTQIARTLQQGLVPATLEAPPNWEAAVLFRAAGTANEVGGDFYDVVKLDDGWLAFVGDVAGKGAPAAALTARARYTMISVAQLTGQPGRALQEINSALVARGGLAFCTVGCLRLHGSAPGGVIDVLSAGHPPPFVLNGAAAAVGESGPLLGLDPAASWTPHRLELDPGQAIVLYSDGVTDTMGPQRERFGETRLEQLLSEGSADSARDLVERIDRRLLEFQDSDQRDDVAVLVLRRQE